jgi:predicted RNA-binding Zn-ribbon protein involved in translation (DUF1610 family)
MMDVEVAVIESILYCPSCYVQRGNLNELRVASIRYPEEGVYCPYCGWKGADQSALEQFSRMADKEL